MDSTGEDYGVYVGPSTVLNTSSSASSAGNEASLESYYRDGEDNNYKVLFEFVLHGIFLNLIGVIGLVGNGICIAILSRPQMKGSTNLILCALSCFDIVVITTSMMMFR
jgi:hypothetical protein